MLAPEVSHMISPTPRDSKRRLLRRPGLIKPYIDKKAIGLCSQSPFCRTGSRGYAPKRVSRPACAIPIGIKLVAWNSPRCPLAQARSP